MRRRFSMLVCVALLGSLLTVPEALAKPVGADAQLAAPMTAAATPALQPGAGQFVPVAPTSVINGAAIAAAGTSTVTVTGANGLPAAAQVSAVAVQVTAIGTSAAGWVQTFAAGTTRPSDSTTSFVTGRNSVSYDVVPVSASGQISVYSSAASKVWVRLRGYFTSTAAATAGSTFVPLPPTTVVNNVALAANGTTNYTFAGANGIPAAADVAAVAIDMVSAAPTAAGVLKAYPTGATAPADASVEYPVTQAQTNYETVRLSSAGQATFAATGATKLTVRLRGYYATPAATVAGASYVPVARAAAVNGVALAAGGTTTATLAGANGVPAAAGVAAVDANVNSSTPTAAGLVTGYAAGTTRPSDASVYYANAISTAAHDTLKISSAGQTTFYASGATKLFVRLRGYYKKPTAPLAPTGVTAAAADGRATVGWIAPKDGGAAVTGYTVTANPGNLKTTVGVADSATVTGLTNGTPYTFTVQAINAVGAGPASVATKAVVPMGGEVLYAHDAAGRIKAVFTSDGAGVAYQYDAVGNITATQALPAGQLAIAQAGPATAVVGDSYEIYGTGFGLDPAQVSVRIGGQVAVITSLRRNHIVATVPAGAASGQVQVIVSGTTATAGSVTLLSAPQVTAASPAIVDRGGVLTISGSNFAPATTANTVSINGTKLQVLTVTANTLTVRAPGFGVSGPVVVRTRAGTATSSGRVTAPPAPFLAADVAASVHLATDAASTINLTTSNQIALFSIDATPGQRLGFQIDDTINGCYEAHIWAPDRSPVVAAETLCGTSFLEVPRAATAGTYLVELDPRDPVTGSFTALAKQSADITTPITIDGPAGSLTTTTAPAHTTFTFTGTQGQLVFTTLTAPGKLANGAVLWGPHGQKLNSTGTFYGTTSGYLSAVLLPENGTYTVDVDPYNFDVGTYTAQVNLVPAPVSATTTIDGPAARLTIAKPGQTGSVSFNGTQGQVVHLDIAPQLTTTSIGKVSMRGPDGSFLTRDQSWTYFMDYIADRYTLTQTGEYLLLIEPDGAQTGTVDITANTIPADAVVTTTIDAAAVAVGNQKPGQSARLTFPATAGQRVFISCEMIAGHEYDISYQLFNPAGTKVGSASCSSVAKGILFDTLALTQGTWTVVVDPSRALIVAPKLRAVSVPADLAVTSALGQSPAVTLAPGQNAVVSFPVTAGQRFYIGCTLTDPNQQYDLDFQLLRPDGTKADNSSCYNSFKGELFDTVTAAAAGNWSVKVDPRLNAAASATLALIAVPADVSTTATIGGAAVSFDTAVGQNATAAFTGTAGQRVLVSCGLSDWAAKQYDVSFKLLRPDGTTEKSTGCYESSHGMLVDTLALPAAGTWTLAVDPDYMVTTHTTVRLYAVPDDLTKSATVGGAGVSVTTAVGQSASITFSGTASQKIKATVSASTYPSCGGFVRLRDSAGTNLTSTCLSASSTLTYTLPTAGTYTLFVDPADVYTGTATVAVANNTAVAGDQPVAAEKPDPRDMRPRTVVPAADDDDDEEAPPPVYPRVRDAALTGKILRTDGKPLAGVTVRVADRAVRTKADGSFVLKRLPQGTWLFVMDGRTASSGRTKYGYFDVQVNLRKGSQKLFYQPYLPILDTASEVKIASPTTAPVVIRTPKVKGLEVHIPAGVRITDADGKAVTKVGITPIPVDRTPIPMPKGVQVPVYFTVQPAGGELHGGEAKVYYPNYLDQKPGTELNFWTHEKYAEGWEIYGRGTVTPDGTQVIPDQSTGIENFDGAMINVDGWLEALGKGILEALGSAGDPVDLGTGRFTYTQSDLALGGFIPIEAQRAYNSGDGRARPFGMGTIGTYDTFLTSRRQWQEADLNLIDGSQVHFVRTSPGTGWSDAAFAAAGTVGQFASATLIWNGAGWDLKLRDGTVLVYGELAPLQGIRDRFGHYVNIRRTAKNAWGNQVGAVTSVTSSEGYWLTYDYDTSGQVTGIHDNAGRTVSYTYDNGLLKTVTDVNGGVTTYGWDSSKRLTTITDAKNQVFLTNTYDANNRVVQQKLADDGLYKFDYTLDSTGKKVTKTVVTDPAGAKRTVEYDAGGYLVKDTSATGSADERGYSVERDPTSHLPMKATDTNGRVMVSTYNANQQATSTTVSLGTESRQESATYNGPEGAMDSATDALGHTTRYTFDAAGNVATATDPEGRKTSYEWNSDGLMTKQTPDGGGATTYEYQDGLTSAATDPLGRKTSYGIDLAGRVQETVNSDGGVSTVQYDAANQVLSTKDPVGAVTKYTYDKNGNMESLEDARGGTTRWSYDVMDRVHVQTDQLGKTTTFTYNALGRPLTVTDRRGLTTEYRYDALQREVFTGYGRTGTPGAYQYQSTLSSVYDDKGRLSSLTDSTAGAGAISYTYDDQDRVKTETTAGGTITREWDDADRLTALKVPGLPDTVYEYDKSDRLTKVTRGSVAAAYGYDGTGRLKTQALPGGVVRTADYNLAGELTGLTFANGSQTLGDLTYDYDSAGRLDRSGGSWARADLPAPVTSTSFDAANRLTAQDGVNRTYDPEGNLTGDGTSTYSWNARGELTATTGAAGTSQVRYDPLGRRIATTVDSESWSFDYDGDNLLSEDGPGTADATYLSGLDTDSAVARVDGLDGAGGASALLTDRQGSVVARTVPGTSTVAAEYTYGPYGTSRSSLTGDPSPVRYTGRESGAGVPKGLQFQRARWYDPATGRFLSEDPAGFDAAGPNLYSYVDGDPVDATDPTGEVPQIIAACVGGAAVNTLAGVLLGRKHTAGDYLRGLGKGCAEGVLMFGVGKFLSVGLRSVRPLTKVLDETAETAAKFCSFTGETLVLMADGTKKPISQIEVGDEVLATDPETGEQGPHKVTQVFVHEDEVVDLEVGGQHITTTEDHPFWNATDGRFEPVAELDSGDRLQAADGRRFTIQGLVPRSTRSATAYNLSVEGVHTYHVGDAELLVHNSCGPTISKGRWDHIWKRHVNRTKYPHKSKFNTTNKAKIERMINRALGGETGDGVYYYRFPSSIGTTAAGDPQYYIRVVVRKGKVITAFPSGAP
ncbi:polymorphic toxin-type HINT domain-containing protein [Kribbella sp. NPDC058245]|uniref:polymorphic toxin-type HINT domain-containing protein n=1 Tax=Kribbella sp. NPDC058245 TaxID=3346399 RepID=UPI0036EEC585